MGSSSTPNAMPSFLASTLPQISNTLLALDISANFLVAVPPALASCLCLEELNIASNPLRVLPVFLSNLTSLRVLIADATGISTLPDSYCELDKLHTLSVRRNKMNALPSWLCLLFSLQTLFVDGNPFQGPWKALVDPLLAKVPMTPAYPPSTPVWPLPSASTASSANGNDTDTDDFSDPPTADQDGKFTLSPEDEDTITPERSPFIGRDGRATTQPNSVAWREGQLPQQPENQARRGLTRTRTTPNRAAYDRSRTDSGTSPADSPAPQQPPAKPVADSGYFDARHEVRRMKSAGELRGTTPEPSIPEAVPRHLPIGSPARPIMTHYATSASSSNLLNTPETESDLVVPKRFASLGVSSRSPSKSVSGSRPALTQSLWDNISESDDDPNSSPESNRTSSARNPNTPAKNFREQRQSSAENSPADRNSTVRINDGKEKGRWGFLKKMSMGKMRIESPPSSGRATPMNRPIPDGPMPPFNGATRPPNRRETTRPPPSRSITSPRIDMRFSTTGALDPLPSVSVVPTPSAVIQRKPSANALKAAPAVALPPSNNLLVPSSSPTPRSAKRRSFLPIDTPGPIRVPTPSSFIPGITASNDEEADRFLSPTLDTADQTRREEEKHREASTRALRSVMAYLKDMNDLNQSQAAPVSMFGSDEGLGSGSRSRRPTVVESGRGVSDSAIGTVSRSGSFGQLRSSDSMAGLRNGGSTQTMSVATTDSSGSGEERKYKDDKSKRAMVVREIVE